MPDTCIAIIAIVAKIALLEYIMMINGEVDWSAISCVDGYIYASA